MTIALRLPAVLVERSQYGVASDFAQLPVRQQATYRLADGAAADLPAVELAITYSDLESFPSGDWKIIATDDGIPSISDGVKGVLSLAASDGTAGDNDEIYLSSAMELFKFLDDKPLMLEASIQFTEANIDDANVAVGFANAVAADLIVNNGAGMKTSGSMLAIYKVDGGTKWNVVSSCNTTQLVNTSTTTAGGSSYQTLKIEATPQRGSVLEVKFFVDGVQLVDAQTTKPIIHRLDYSSSPTEMNAFAGVKNGGTNTETLNLDYLVALQAR